MEDGSKSQPARLTEARRTSLLHRLNRREPSSQSWATLFRLAAKDHGPAADHYVADLLTADLAQRPPNHLSSRINTLGRFLSSQTNVPLILALASQAAPAGRQLALAILANWPRNLEEELQRALEKLLPDRQLPLGPKLKVLASLHKYGRPESKQLAEFFPLLIQGRSKKRSIHYLQKLRNLIGPNPALENLLQEVEGLVRMDCPRCQVQLRQREMIRHLWDAHEMVLDGRRVRDPWSLIEDWIELYRADSNPETLEQCRQLAGRIGEGRGSVRFEQILIQAGITPENAKQRLLNLAKERHASVCPWCYALAPQSSDVPPAKILHLNGLLVSEGYKVDLSEQGLRTSLTVETSGRVIYLGPEPSWPLTGRGLGYLIAAPLVAAALACSIGVHHYPTRPLIPVVVFLVLTLLGWNLVGWLWKWLRLPLPERALYYAWTFLAPSFSKGGFSEKESAFLAGLVLHSSTQEQAKLRRRFLPKLLDPLQESVGKGKAPSSHLAILRRQVVQDAIANGADPVRLVVDQVSLCFEGKLPLRYADELLNGWETHWWTPGNLNRFRVLLCHRAFEVGYEVRNLLDLGQTVPSLGVVLRTEQLSDLEALRLLWSQRATLPWEKCGPAQTVFDLALDPESAKLLGEYPDLLLIQELPDWAWVRQREQEVFQPVRIMLYARGVFCQNSLFTAMPRQTEMSSQWRSSILTIDEQRFESRKSLDPLEKRLEHWFRFAFLDFLPRVSQVLFWQPPDRATLFRSWGAQACAECQRFFIPKIGQLGIAQREDAPVAQIVGNPKPDTTTIGSPTR